MIIRSLGLSEWIILARRGALGFQEHVLGSQAWSVRLAIRQSVVGQLFPRGEHWHTWVATDGREVTGLVCTGPRRGRQVWQVTHLLVVGDVDANEVSRGLLQQITGASCFQGIEKLFLRLPQDSPLTQAVIDSGFERYLVQRLYRRVETSTYYGDVYSRLDGIWRTKTRHDDWPIFQLYTAAVPATVRQAEGLAYADWLRSRERFQGGEDLVWERNGHVHGWASVRPWRDGFLLESVLPPDEESAFASLVEGVAARGRPLYSLISSYETRLHHVAEDEGFRFQAECALFVKRLLVRVPQTYLVPMRA